MSLLQLLQQQGLVIDSETGGRKFKTHPLIQVGAGPFRPDLQPQDVKSMALPFTAPRKGDPQAVGLRQFYASLSPWSRRQYRRGGAWHRREADLIGQQTATTVADAQDWLGKEIAGPVSKGKWLIGHNVRFDADFLAYNMRPEDYQAMTARMGEGISSSAKRRQGLYPTFGPAARGTRDLARYEKFIPYLKESLTTGRGGIADSQMFVSASLAYAKKHKLINPRGNFSVGTSVSAGHFAFTQKSIAESFPGSLQHTVEPDIAATSQLATNYFSLAEQLRETQQHSSQQIWDQLSLPQRKALRFHEELQPLLAAGAKHKFLVDAEHDIRTLGETELNKTSGMTTSNLQDFFPLFEKDRQAAGYSYDLQKMINQVKGLSKSELEGYVSGATTYFDEADLFAQAWQRAEADPRPWFDRSSKWQQLKTTRAGYGQQAQRLAERSWNAIRRRPFVSLTGGFAAIFLGLSAFPGKKDDYNTIEGLQHGWFGKERAQHTDFGSGYQGLKEDKKTHVLWTLLSIGAEIGLAFTGWRLKQIARYAIIGKRLEQTGEIVGFLHTMASLKPKHNKKHSTVKKNNSFEGLKHQGIAGDTRKGNTDFGSGYQGPRTSNSVTQEEVRPPWYYRALDKVFSYKYFGTALLAGIGGLMAWRFAKHAIPAWQRQAEAGGLGLWARNYWERSKTYLSNMPSRIGTFFSEARTTAREANLSFWDQIKSAAGYTGRWVYNLTKESLKTIGQGIWEHRYSFAAGAFLGGTRSYYREDEASLKFALKMGAWDVVDDIAVVAGAGRVLKKTGWFGEFFEDPYIQKAMTGMLGYSVGTIAGAMLKHVTHRDTKVKIAARRRKQQTNPAKYVGLPQHLDRNKINHHKMQGY